VLRRTLGTVPQNTFLFSATIRENMAFGVTDPSEEFLREMARLSALDRDLGLFPRGWDTMVGEKGLTLSGGQKQRVSISRALAVEPEVLIFDDALSAVDTETEERILRNFLELRRGRTNIVGSHRVSTLMEADRVLVLEEGRIVQEGTPGELLNQEGFFRRIHDLQQICRSEEGECTEDGHGR